MKTISKILLFFVVIQFYSCATLFHGRMHRVSITSEPSGASIFINGVDTKRTTPAEIKIKKKQPETEFNKKNELVYVLKKPNYYDGVYHDMSKYDPLATLDWYFYVVPGAIDVALGSNRVYSEDISIKLNEMGKVIVRTDTVVKYIDGGKSKYKFQKKSDVDNSIPKLDNTNPYRFALIIGNEDYSSSQVDLNSEINVEFAKDDASAFKEYAMNVLGIPEKNVIFLLDATTGQMNQGISKLNLIIKNTQGNSEVFVYYAGHGLPDEQTKEAYIMPVDVSGKNASEGIMLKEMYGKLTEFPSKNVTVFIDACFSGGARKQGLVAARGVKVKPKEEMLKGNILVFSASSGEQSSLSYKEKNHGLFTYFLLKKLKDSNGMVNYGDLYKFIKDNVSLESVLVNDKEQTPQINVSDSIMDKWEKFKLN